MRFMESHSFCRQAGVMGRVTGLCNREQGSEGIVTAAGEKYENSIFSQRAVTIGLRLCFFRQRAKHKALETRKRNTKEETT
ncbi:hypothetical protein [Pseudoflavonifractor capillosus]|uniref:hypothetical protein n=1 Tax=Pseudoflavonifractor capillosus TaxID=106588 RepID=UPI0023F73EAD|nr:hypothetical protein [Pseudoflavonifractor capillosus]